MKICLNICYQGSDFHGWQTQPTVVTVQETLEVALTRVADDPVKVICAGRTDSGVHGLGQIVHFECTKIRTMEAWVRGTNRYLPDSIKVLWALPVDDDFHARFSARARRYQYFIYASSVPLPYLDAFQLRVNKPLDTARMQQAAQCLLGKHDFSAFRGAHCEAHSAIRTISHLQVLPLFGDRWVVDIEANAFLLHMVRNIVGCLLPIGAGEKDVEWLQYVLESRDRRQAGLCISPRGLHFVSVKYPDSYAEINQATVRQTENFMAQMTVPIENNELREGV